MNKVLYTVMMFGLALGTTGTVGCTLDSATAQDGSEIASDEAALANAGASTQALEIRNVTCNSGWPGTRGCSWKFSSPSAIVPGTITVQINGNNGEIGHAAAQLDSFNIAFTASVNEGDAFNPGKNTTSYTVVWLRN
jgi:hypothetical protein